MLAAEVLGATPEVVVLGAVPEAAVFAAELLTVDPVLLLATDVFEAADVVTGLALTPDAAGLV